MFCKYCGKKMEAWTVENSGYIFKEVCRDCNVRVGWKKPRQFYCIACGTPIPRRVNKFGWLVYTGDKFCLLCKGERKSKKYAPNSRYSEPHRRAALKWQRNNLEKTKVQSLTKAHPERLNILYECPCPGNEKHNHHFDYSRPFDVIRLCGNCHRAEHKRLRSLATPALVAVNG